MTLLFVRLFFLVLIVFVGYYLGGIQSYPFVGMGLGFFAGGILILLESSLRRVSVRGLSSMVFGLLLGVFMAKLVSDILSLLPFGEFVHSGLRVVLTLVFSYLGTVMALRGKDEFHLIIPYVRFKREDRASRVILLDTSVIIDGRVVDIYKTNFFAGRLVVSRAVLTELQKIADSKDSIKRDRGRRGLDLVRSMQKEGAIDLRIHEDDLTEEKDVDMKLIKLAKIMEAAICTTDYNLGRNAVIQGIEVLNINELVVAVKPVVFVGDELEAYLVKEGKESGQAVAYTDDGTMIVVSNSRELIGKKVCVEVTSILQTHAGRMIFANLKG